MWLRRFKSEQDKMGLFSWHRLYWKRSARYTPYTLSMSTDIKSITIYAVFSKIGDKVKLFRLCFDDKFCKHWATDIKGNYYLLKWRPYRCYRSELLHCHSRKVINTCTQRNLWVLTTKLFCENFATNLKGFQPSAILNSTKRCLQSLYVEPTNVFVCAT